MEAPPRYDYRLRRLYDELTRQRSNAEQLERDSLESLCRVLNFLAVGGAGALGLIFLGVRDSPPDPAGTWRWFVTFGAMTMFGLATFASVITLAGIAMVQHVFSAQARTMSHCADDMAMALEDEQEAGLTTHQAEFINARDRARNEGKRGLEEWAPKALLGRLAFKMGRSAVSSAQLIGLAFVVGAILAVMSTFPLETASPSTGNGTATPLCDVRSDQGCD